MAPQDRKLNRLLRQRGAGLQRQVESDFFKITVNRKPSAEQNDRPNPPKQPLASRRSSRRTPQPLSQRQSSRKTPASRTRPENAVSARKHVATQARISVPDSMPAQVPVQPIHTPAAAGKRNRTNAAVASPDIKEEDADEIAGDEEHHSTARRVTKTPSTRSSLSGSARSAVEPDELATDYPHFHISSAGRSVSIRRLRRQSERPINADINMPSVQTNSPARPPSTSSSSPPVSILANKRKRPLPSIAGAEAGQENKTTVFIPNRRMSHRNVLSVSKEHISGKEPAPTPDHDEFAILTVIVESPNAQAQSRTKNAGYSITNHPAPGTLHASTPHHAAAPMFTSPLFEPGSAQYLHDHQAKQEDSANDGTISVRGDSDDELVPGTLAKKSPKEKRKAKPDKEPFNQSRRGRKRSIAGDNEAQLSKRRNTHKGTLVPVTVYRPSMPFPRLTSTGQDTDSDQDDLAHDPITEPDSAVNPVDVLAQITSELISSYITSFSEKARTSSSSQRSGALSAQAKRRRHVLQRFNFVLSDSLLTLSTALNAGTALESRLRKTKRQRVHLCEELLQLRQQRDDVRRRMDEVRAQHARKMELAERRRDLVQGLEDLAEAVRRGREKARVEGREDEAAEPDPAVVYDDVQALVGGGGLVGRVRAWNERLELAAVELERADLSAP